MAHFESVVLVDTLRQWMLPSRDKANSCLLSLAQARDWFKAELTWTGNSTTVLTVIDPNVTVFPRGCGDEASTPLKPNFIGIEMDLSYHWRNGQNLTKSATMSDNKILPH